MLICGLINDFALILKTLRIPVVASSISFEIDRRMQRVVFMSRLTLPVSIGNISCLILRLIHGNPRLDFLGH